MKKIGSIIIAFSFIMILLPSVSFASEKTGKDLASELVSNPNVWEAFSNSEKGKVRDFAEKDALKVKKKIDNIAGSNAPIEVKNKVLEKIWQKLGEDEKLSYLTYVTPVEQEESNVIIPNLRDSSKVSSVETESLAIDEPIYATRAAAYTNSFYKNLIGKNIWGGKLFEFWTKNTWGYDKVKILSINPSEGQDAFEAGWSYAGKVLETWYNYNNFDYHRNVEGNFELNIVTRWQKATVYHDTRIRANGAWSATSDVSGAYTN